MLISSSCKRNSRTWKQTKVSRVSMYIIVVFLDCQRGGDILYMDYVSVCICTQSDGRQGQGQASSQATAIRSLMKYNSPY